MPLKVASIPTKTANSSRSSLRLRKCVCPAVALTVLSEAREIAVALRHDGFR